MLAGNQLLQSWLSWNQQMIISFTGMSKLSQDSRCMLWLT